MKNFPAKLEYMEIVNHVPNTYLHRVYACLNQVRPKHITAICSNTTFPNFNLME